MHVRSGLKQPVSGSPCVRSVTTLDGAELVGIARRTSMYNPVVCSVYRGASGMGHAATTSRGRQRIKWAHQETAAWSTAANERRRDQSSSWYLTIDPDRMA